MGRIGVLLSGCGAKDGSEIHESVITLLALDQAGVKVSILAPNTNQHHVVDHLSNNELRQSRNILSESARIARGNILPVEDINNSDLDALIFPGGTGMAKNIFNYAIKGSDFTILKSVELLTQYMIINNKPLGAICIAPVMIAKVLQNMGRSGTLTGGFDNKISSDIESMGVSIQKVDAKSIVVDYKNKIVSTPAYVETKSIKEVNEGIIKLINQLLKMI